MPTSVGLWVVLALAACGSVRHGDDKPSSANAGAGASPSEGGQASPHGGMSGDRAGTDSTGMAPEGGASSKAGSGAGTTSLSGTGGVPPYCDGLSPGKSDFGNPRWDTSWFLSGCKESPYFPVCATAVDCPAGGSQTMETFPTGGVPGQNYKVKFRFSAVVEANQYQGGTRDATLTPADVHSGLWDSFYRDGEPTPSSAAVWKLTVYDNAGTEARHFYLNAFPAGSVFESEQTFLVQFEKTIVVVGGGKIEHLVHDPDCLSNDNCGPHVESADGCTAARTLPAPDNVHSVPAHYQDPEDHGIKPTTLLNAQANGSLQQPWHSQLGRLTVLSVEPTDDPVITDYP